MRPFSGRETGIGTMVTPRYAGTKVRITQVPYLKVPISRAVNP